MTRGENILCRSHHPHDNGKEGHWGNGGCKCNCVSTAPHSLSISKFSKIEKKVRETKADTQKRLILHLKVLFSKLRKRLRQTNKCTKTNEKKRRDNQTHLDKSRHTHKRSFPTSKSHTYKDTHTHKRSHLAIMTFTSQQRWGWRSQCRRETPVQRKDD